MKKLILIVLLLLSSGCATQGYTFLCKHNLSTETKEKEDCIKKSTKMVEDGNPLLEEIKFPLHFILGVPKEYRNY